MKVANTYAVEGMIPDHFAVVSKRGLWAGRILSAIPVLFLLVDAAGKLLRLPPVVEGTVRLGYPESLIIPLGVIEMLCVILYIIPRTAVPGILLLTGYLGGAVATHVRIGDPLFSHVLFPVYVAVLLYAGLILRDERLRAFVQRK